MVVEDVVEGGDEDDARGEVRLGGEEVVEEGRDAHLEERLVVHCLLLRLVLPRAPRDLRLARRNAVNGVELRGGGIEVAGVGCEQAWHGIALLRICGAIKPKQRRLTDRGWLASTKGPASTTTSGFLTAMTRIRSSSGSYSSVSVVVKGPEATSSDSGAPPWVGWIVWRGVA